MNKNHAEVCSSAEWAEDIRDVVLPQVLGEASLGDDVLEIGPGYGPATEVLRGRVGRLTAVEIDPELATALAQRFPSVTVVQASGATMPFEDSRFSSAVTCTMLHHVPTDAIQDSIFAETFRVLRPGGVFAGSDSMDTDDRREFHEDDVFNPVDPNHLGERLRRAGFEDPLVTVRRDGDYFTFTARRAS